MKNFIEVSTNRTEKLLLNINQISAVESVDDVSNGCIIITTIISDGENKIYYARCSFNELKKLMEEAV